MKKIKEMELTPKEKAKELVTRFSDVEDCQKYEKFITTKEMAKECALIAVDEIWTELEKERVFEKYDYWHEVRKEIESL